MRGRWQAVRVVVRNRNVLRLVASFGGWMAGEWAFLVILSVVAFDRGGVAAVGIAGAIRVIPTAVLAPLGSWVADRVSRANLLAVVHASWCALSLVAALVTAMSLPLWTLYLTVGIAAAVASAFRGTINALLPQLVDTPEELTSANSVYGLVEALGALGGPLLAAVVLGVGSPAWAFVAVATVYGLSALTTPGIRGEHQPARPMRRRSEGRRVRLGAAMVGFTTLVGSPVTRAVYLSMMAQCLMRGFVNVVVVTASLTIFGTGQSGAAQLFAAVGIGGLIGATVLVGVTGRRVALPFAVGVGLWGLPVIGIAAFPYPAVAWAALALIGFGNALEDVFGFTILNRYVPDHVAGRVYGLFWGTAAGGVALGSLVAPVLVGALSLRPAMAVSGALVALAPVLAWRSLSSADADGLLSEHDVRVLKRLPVFNGLSCVAIERLARSVREVPVQPGDVVVRQGDAADGFYVVDTGEFSVAVDGRPAPGLGEGDGFGEIALYHATRRTATVTAVTPGRLLYVDGAAFVGAVTGHRGADTTAADLARARLDTARPAQPEPGLG